MGSGTLPSTLDRDLRSLEAGPIRTQPSDRRRVVAAIRSAHAQRFLRISINLIGAAGAAFFVQATLRV